MDAYKKILVGTDGSDTATRAVRYAAKLASAQGSDLLIVHAAPKDGEGSPGPERTVETALETAREEGANASSRMEYGDPAEVMIQVSEDEGTDLIVLGNKGMTGVRRFTLGSVPNKVSHHAPCDVLIARTS